MNSSLIPFILTFAALVAGIISYTSIRKGGARYYTLERELVLRQAIYSLFAAIILFLGAIGWLMFNATQILESTAVDSGLATQPGSGLIVTETPFLQTFPPTPTMTPTIDPNIPTLTPTPIIRRAVISGTSGNGLTLRDKPGGSEISVLAEGTIVTLLDEAPINFNNFVWLKVRTINGDQGWLADAFLTIRDR